MMNMLVGVLVEVIKTVSEIEREQLFAEHICLRLACASVGISRSCLLVRTCSYYDSGLKSVLSRRSFPPDGSKTIGLDTSCGATMPRT